MAHTCWVLCGLSPVGLVKAKQGSTCTQLQSMMLSVGGMDKAGGETQRADTSSSFKGLKCAALSSSYFCK